MGKRAASDSWTQYVVFSFEKGLNGQNYSLTDFHHPMKKFLLLPKFPPPSPHWKERFIPYVFNAIWKTMACFFFPSQGLEIISTYLLVRWDLWLRLVIGNRFLVSTWKYWIWIWKNESILRTAAWDTFLSKIVCGCVTLFQLEKYRLVYWINAREWPKHTLTSQ